MWSLLHYSYLTAKNLIKNKPLSLLYFQGITQHKEAENLKISPYSVLSSQGLNLSALVFTEGR